jgi:hypothetical protein
MAQVMVTSNCSRKTAAKLLSTLTRARLVHLIKGERPHFKVVLKKLHLGFKFASN